MIGLEVLGSLLIHDTLEDIFSQTILFSELVYDLTAIYCSIEEIYKEYYIALSTTLE